MLERVSLAKRTIIIMAWMVLISLSLADRQTVSQKYQIQKLDINSDEAKFAAEFAVRELSKLSDSGVYTTIELSRIVTAEFQNGVYHENTILNLELSSPCFKSGKPVESFEIVVMKHFEDGVRSFAINQFPEMNEDAIEEFYIRKVEARRRKREESFRRLELAAFKSAQYATDSLDNNNINDSNYDCLQQIDNTDAANLLSQLDSPDQRASRQQAGRDRVTQSRVHEFVAKVCEHPHLLYSTLLPGLDSVCMYVCITYMVLRNSNYRA